MALKVSATGKMLVNENGKLTCACCVCPTPTLLCATASASKSKCGFSEFTGFVSSPPKIYLKSTLSGFNMECNGDTGCSPEYEGDYSTFRAEVQGACEYDPITCATTNGKQGRVGSAIGPTCSTPTMPAWGASACSAHNGMTGAPTFDGPTSATLWVAYQSVDPSAGRCEASGTQYDTLSDEYTTPALIDNMLADLGTPGTPTTCVTAIIASFSLSSDELTASGKAGAYAFSIPGDAPDCYKITWDEVVTTNGTPAVTPKEYTWDGAATQSPTINIAVPGDNTATGLTAITVTIENIVVTCTGCA